MAQNQHINKVVFGSATLVDLTGTTATADKILQGYGAYGADGAWMDGTAEAGGGSSYTLVATQEFEASTTKTSAALLGTIELPTDAWTSDKLLYVKVRDKAGQRPGYFWGTDSYILNYSPAIYDESAPSYYSTNQICWGVCYRRDTSKLFYQTATGKTSLSLYGVYYHSLSATSIAPPIFVRIYTRYNSTYSLTIDGTYVVEVYLLDWPDGISPFE